MKQKFVKIKKLLPRKMQTKRAAYFGMALLIIFSIFTYDIFFRSPKVKAATVGTSSSAAGSGSIIQRRIVITSKGTIVSFFNSGTQSVTGIAYSTSADNGATWGSAVQVDSTQNDNFSVAIDSANNIYLAFTVGGTSGGVKFRMLTYASGTWSIGAAVAVASNTGSSTFLTFLNPNIAVLNGGKLFIAYNESTNGSIEGSYSTNKGTSWTQGSTTLSLAGAALRSNIAADGSSIWIVAEGILYADIGGLGVFSPATQLQIPSTTLVSLSYGLDSLHIIYNSSGINYLTYNIATGALSSATALSANSNDVVGSVVSDSQNVWAIWQSYVASNSYNVVYKQFNGASWDVSSTAITTDNLNNVSINSPERMANNANIPVVWSTGTASPYTVKATTFSSLGGVTDTGNQAGNYTGTLTGSSGNIVVKCGTWFYNTVNIVSGMTLKICASNGLTGGKLTIYANSVTVAGTIDGAGRGLPGGVAIYGTGGTGGFGPFGGAGAAGGNGAAGFSFAGGSGAGPFYGAAGSAGTSSAGGATGASSALNVAGSSGGIGTTTTVGTAGTLAGYLASGTNGDASTDESLVSGSGGGGGGSGGSGAGGGGGASATPTCAAGGLGGSGAPGGRGGKGGNGGAQLAIYANGNLTVSGSVSVTGQTGTSAGSGNTGSNGTDGGSSANTC